MAKVELVLNNLNCPHCSAKIEETVKKHTAKKIYQNEFGVKVIFRAGTG